MLVSIVIPWHRNLEDLKRALDSVFAQKGADLEVIVVANGVDDATFGAAEAITDDPRYRLVRRAEPGASAARNHAMALAHGQLIFFLDADDVFCPGKVAAFVAAYEALPFALAFSRGTRDRGAGTSWPMPAAQWEASTPLAEFLFCAGNNISTSALVIDAGAKDLLRFNHLASPYEDPDLLIQAEAAGLVIRMLPEMLYRWNDQRAAGRLSRSVDATARLAWIAGTPVTVSARARAAFRARCVAQHVFPNQFFRCLVLFWRAWRLGGIGSRETILFVLRGLLPAHVGRKLVDVYLGGKARMVRHRAGRGEGSASIRLPQVPPERLATRGDGR